MLSHVFSAATLPATPDSLYDMYLDAETHAAFTGKPVIIEPRVDAPFSAFNGMLSGKILRLQPKHQVVQSWRSGNWPPDAIDSILILTFYPEGDGARIDLMHLNVPDSDIAGVSEGWVKYYWNPWREYLLAEKDK